jgi:hypothetical protein
MGGYIAVDLDGTLAHYNSGEFKELVIGAPIPKMVDRVKKWLAEGKEVRIFTARVSHEEEREEIIRAIEEWCEKHIGQKLAVTNIKDYGMIELWDDRAIQVIPNKGITLQSEVIRVREKFDKLLRTYNMKVGR